MGKFPNGEEAAEPQRAPAEADQIDPTPIEFQPESGALAPCEEVDEAERERDPREDL